MKKLIFISFFLSIFFSTNSNSQSIDKKPIFQPISKEEQNLSTHLKNYLTLSFITAPKKSINYLPNELLEVMIENSNYDLSREKAKNIMKQDAKNKKNQLPSGNKKFIIHEILNRVEQENQIIYIVHHSIIQDNQSDRLTQSIKKELINNPESIEMRTICTYNQFNQSWTYFEHKNNEFTEQVLNKMFKPKTVTKILEFESNK